MDMFSTPVLRTFNHQENKDALTSRKAGVTNSGRKPLGDRSNNNAFKSEIKPLKVINKETPKVASIKKPTSTNTIPDWYAEMCTFKTYEDSDEDILPKSQRFNKGDIIKMNEPPITPPPRYNLEINSMILEIPEDNIFKVQDSSTDLKKITIDDNVGFPDFVLF